MSISAVTSAFSNYASSVVGSSSSTAGSSSGSSALQEAKETVAQTKKEAANGDHVAKAKLAREQQQQPAASEPGKGTLVDKAA